MTVYTHSIGKEISSVIAQSQHRCSKFMQRETWQVPRRAQGLTFELICRRKMALLTITQVMLGNAWEFMDDRPCTLLVLDELARTLSRCGDPQTVEQLAELGFRDGSYRAESIADSCVLSLATMPGQSTRIFDDQHFERVLYPWSFCSTPVFDSHGRLFGSILLCRLVEHECVSDLSLTLAIAREVGSSLLTDSLLAEPSRHLNQMHGLLESIDNGVMAQNEQGVLQFFNVRVALLLRLDAQAGQGKDIHGLLSLPMLLRRVIKHARGLSHVEVTFESQHQFADVAIILKPIVEEQGNSLILLLHPVEQIRQLMTSQLGKMSHAFERISTDDPETRHLTHFGRQAARGSFPILLCREESVGKELLSQAIHNESERVSEPYIAVNCQLYANSVLGQDFMGSALTDDGNGRSSRLELTNGGTLFLEKIEYLAPELRSALLQVTRRGVLIRPDIRRLIPVDVKVIVTATVDLTNLVEQDRFSRQLYYVLHSFEIVIPLLRARRNSIPSLIYIRLNSLKKHFSSSLKIDDDALARLVVYS